MRLSPFDPYSFLFSLARGSSHFRQRQLPEAVAWLRKAAQQNPRYSQHFLFLGSALAHAGRMEEARAAIRRLLELHPADSVTWRRQHRWLDPEADFEYVVEGARLAGSAGMTEQRRLAAIVAADIVGYSRLLSADEPGTLSRVRALRLEIIEPIAQANDGRIFKTTGDGFLAAFASAVQAVRAAIAIQQAVRQRDDGLRLRIGVHQGEVVSEGDDFLGDGVIIASRLEVSGRPRRHLHLRSRTGGRGR